MVEVQLGFSVSGRHQGFQGFQIAVDRLLGGIKPGMLDRTSVAIPMTLPPGLERDSGPLPGGVWLHDTRVRVGEGICAGRLLGFRSCLSHRTTLTKQASYTPLIIVAGGLFRRSAII
jgi:hypothetical protein